MGGLLKHIGPACGHARRRAGLKQIEIGAEAGVSHAAISRFERGHALPRHGADDLIAAYARETGVSELTLWQHAIDLWHAAE